MNAGLNIGLSSEQIELVVDALKKCGVSSAVVFGSRAKGDWRDNSDVDIAVSGGMSIGLLLACLDELPMPYKFDAVDYNAISSWPLREHIDRVGVELFREATAGFSGSTTGKEQSAALPKSK